MYRQNQTDPLHRNLRNSKMISLLQLPRSGSQWQYGPKIYARLLPSVVVLRLLICHGNFETSARCKEETNPESFGIVTNKYPLLHTLGPNPFSSFVSPSRAVCVSG